MFVGRFLELNIFLNNDNLLLSSYGIDFEDSLERGVLNVFEEFFLLCYWKKY